MDTNEMVRRHQEAAKAQAERKSFRSNIPFFRPQEGEYRVKFLPVGNKQEKLPYKTVMIHTLNVKTHNNKTVTNYIVCWDWLFSHKNAETATIKPLHKMGKLTEADAKLFSAAGNGCPICSAREVMKQAGYPDKTTNQLRAKLSHYWNVWMRNDPNTPENNGKIFVWSMSDARHKEVDGTVMSYLLDEETLQPTGPNVLDMETGHDWKIVATGDRLSRRYKVDIIPKAKPIGEIADGNSPIDLMEVVGESFRNYGDTCRVLAAAYGETLDELGFRWPVKVEVEPKQPKTVAKFGDDDDEEDAPKPEPKKAKAKVFAGFDDEDAEEEVPVKKEKKKAPVVQASEDDEDEEEPPVKSKASNNLKAKTKVPWLDDEDEEDDYDTEGTSSDDEEVAVTGGKLRTKSGKELF